MAGNRNGQNTETDLLASALHHALQGITPAQDSAPRRDDKQNGIEITVDTDVLTLRGTGVDVTPVLLSGQVVLNLAESTPVKQITLQFRGKAKLPPSENEMVSFSNSAMTYIVCNHEWSFLEGEKKHSHTLKAGRHLFPFRLNLGGSLPSTLYTNAYGGASIAYKLRAVAARPGFAHNLQTQKSITLLRSFNPDAHQYLQLLEIENTWPEKIMYCIIVPHKAWAAGDDLTAVVKFSPLAKGVRVLGVETTLIETIKVYSRSGWQESRKPVITARHEFRNGHAVWVKHQDHGHRSGSSHQPGTRGAHLGPDLPCRYNADFNDPPVPHSPEAGSSTASGQDPLPNTHAAGSDSHSIPIDFELSEGDIATKLEVSLPLCMTPTHTLEPIIASHRIRWNILISNPDGHTSELRCSLPLHILDHCLLDEAKSATAQTRQLLLGGPDIPEDNPDLELPSYPSHIRDRIANMYLPDQAILRVTNPWIYQGISPVQDQDGRHSNFTSGTQSPLEAHLVSAPMGRGSSDLEYVNSELLLSALSQHTPSPIDTHRDMASPPETAPPSHAASRGPSRVPSRAPSPDREPSNSQSRAHSRRSSGTGSSHSDAAPSTYVHANSTASRNLHGLFHMTMKPFTSLGAPFVPVTHYHTPPPQPPSGATHQRQHSRQGQGQQHPGTGAPPPLPAAALPRTVPVTSQELLHRAFTEVPDYDIASRGFLGGVTPLETMQGLPSYEEASTQRSRSESDLASMAHRGPHTLPLRRQPGRSVIADLTRSNSYDRR